MIVGLLMRPIVATTLLCLPSLGMAGLHPAGDDTALLVRTPGLPQPLAPPASWSSPALAIP